MANEEGKNKYYKRSHISERKFRELYFSIDLNAEASQLTNISHKM